jgi:5-methylcytosine-specific restriction endonuclease McrA
MFLHRHLSMKSSKYFVPMLQKIRNNTIDQVELAPRKKVKIPSKVRMDIWATYIGEDIAKHKCICCKRVTIRQTEFEVGHVLSEVHGGTLEINNLRPICSVCNKSMGTRNMIDFVKQYGYYI